MQLFYAMLQNDTSNSDWNSADDKSSTDDAQKTVEKLSASQKSD